MTVDESLIRLRELATLFPRDDVPWEERPRFESRSSDEFLEEMQENLGKRLPADLLAFFRACDAIVAMSIHNGYWIGGTKQLMQIAASGDFPARIDTMDVIPAATDGGGNAFLISLGDGTVWRWDHETGATRLVANSFADFLKHVVADWEHYACDDANWQYLV